MTLKFLGIFSQVCHVKIHFSSHYKNPITRRIFSLGRAINSRRGLSLRASQMKCPVCMHFQLGVIDPFIGEICIKS
jgi:hypothetical protein